ncbi:MAG: hypothetical protein KY475_06235 [Planctomycetes bacterium]|nr:hypothetical protein [Planctomycetota bacterium]
MNETPATAIQREIPPALAAAIDRFRADLDELLRNHSGKWAGYGPDGQIALGWSKRSVHQPVWMQDGRPVNSSFAKSSRRTTKSRSFSTLLLLRQCTSIGESAATH